jgi:beta-glucosidase
MFKNRNFICSIGLLTFISINLLPISAQAGNRSDDIQEPESEPTLDPEFDSPVNPKLWPKAESPFNNNPWEERAISRIMSKMTLEQKVGQVIQADSGSITPEDLRQYRLGSVLSGGNSAPGGQPYATVEQWLEAADAYFEASIDPEDVKFAIPVMWGIDAVHGHNNVIGGTIFPHNVGLGATNNPDLIREIGAVAARELRVTGHDWTFAPTIAVPQDDRWGRTYEGFSEDPELVARFAPAYVEGFQGKPNSPDFLLGEKVIATAKHFLADGGTQNGADQGDAVIDEIELRDIHAAGYPPAIEAGVQAVMASFSSWNGRKIHGDRSLLTTILKERIGFDGLLVGDWNAHGQIPGCTNDNCPRAINAGLDMYMAPDSWRGLYENLLAQVQSGEVRMSRLNKAVRRVLRVKYRAGLLFDATKPSDRLLAGDLSVLGSPKHREVARRAVRESLVLLKNNGGLLPLAPGSQVLVAGDGANNIGKQSGGWTLTWQGDRFDNTLFPNSQTIFDGIRETVEAAGGTATYSVSGQYSTLPDVAIVVFGENPYAEFQGDRDDVYYGATNAQDLALLKRLKSEGIPVVSVFLSGRPMWMNPEINASDAFVAAWLPGSEGGGVADVLFRQADGSVNYDFTGRLAFSWPAQADQFDINVVGGTDEPLFAVGHGLTYTDAGDLPELSEDPGDITAGADKTVLFEAGRIGTPWFPAAGSAPVSATPLSLPSSTAAGVEIDLIDKDAQDDALSVTLVSGGSDSTFMIAASEEVDMLRETNADLELALTLRVSGSVPAGTELGMLCAGLNDCGGWVSAAEPFAMATDWTELRVSLSCFASAGAQMDTITAGLALRADGPLVVEIGDARLVQDTDGQETCF